MREEGDKSKADRSGGHVDLIVGCGRQSEGTEDVGG